MRWGKKAARSPKDKKRTANHDLVIKVIMRCYYKQYSISILQSTNP